MTTHHPRPHQRLGQRGEALAAEALRNAGYRIVATDVRTPGGQIDIIATEQDTLAFVEVKTRRSLVYGTPLEAITARKRAHMVVAAQEYLAREALGDIDWRIDVVGIILDKGRPRIEIIRSAVETGM